jgi:hypothetical protein
MDSKELIRDFLVKSKIEFSETDSEFFLGTLKISIPVDGMPKLPKMHFSLIAMEVGMNNLNDLMIELEKLEGAKIYDFRKEKS